MMTKYYYMTQNTKNSRDWFRSSDLWVMGPTRFHCATLLNTSAIYTKKIFLSNFFIFLFFSYYLRKKK